MAEQNIRHYPMIIGGEKVGDSADNMIRNPFDLSTVGSCPEGTAEDVDRAVKAARKAQPGWAAKSDAERAAACQAIAKAFETHKAELSELITREQGKPLDGGGFGSQFELDGCIGWSMATSALSIEEKKLVEDNGVRAVQRRVAKGVVGSITPWNWPLLIAIWHLLPAIRTGNCVVMKPSPLTPLSTLRAAEIISEIVPAGVFNVVTGGAEVGARLTSHDNIDKLIFTGSTETGKHVMKSAAETITDCTLELGGNDPAIVLPGAPIEQMAQGLFFGAFINAGQTCGAIKRIYVSDDQHDALAEEMAKIAKSKTVGNGLESGSDMGPLQNEPQYDKVKSLTKDAVASGARLVTGGEQVGEGYALTPAILADCTNDMGIVRQEQFGPAVPLIRYSSIDEAIELANDSEYGLCASVWGDPAQAQDIVRKLAAGTTYINTHAELNPMVPFGGRKCSGIGVQFGEEGLLAFTDSTVVYERLPA